MTDCQLLVLAAKANGVRWVDETFLYEDFGRMMVDFGEGIQEWNPLQNNEQAFELIVKLKLMLSLHENREAHVIWWDKKGRGEVIEKWTPAHDSLACTRLAIVRAAAEIGRAM